MKLIFTLFASMLLSTAVVAQSTMDVKFERLTTSEGLSNNQINGFFQDHDGYIWIYTLSGLNRFDGYELKKFFHDKSNPISLKNNTVLWMSYGPEGKIWIKTAEGISQYDPNDESFSPITAYAQLLQTRELLIANMRVDKNGESWVTIENRGLSKMQKDGKIIQLTGFKDADVKIASNNVTDMAIDTDGNLWIVHAFGAIEMIDVNENKVVRKYGMPENYFNKDQNLQIFVDQDQGVWIYSQDNPFGLIYLDANSGKTRMLDDDLLNSKVVRDIIQLDNGDFWIGTDHGGITKLDKTSWKSEFIVNDPEISKSLSNNNVNTLFIDMEGIIWVGTTKNGVCYHHKGSDNFKHLKINTKDPAYNDISSIAEDENGNLWMGTNGKGIIHFNPKTNKFKSLNEELKLRELAPEVIVSLLYSRDNVLWIGSYLKGLYKYDGKILQQVEFTEDGSSADLSIWDLYEDSKGNICIGTLNRGLYIYDPKKKTPTVHFDGSNGLTSNYVTSISEDSTGRIWIGSGNGLTSFTPSQQKFKNFFSTDSISNPLSNNSVMNIYCGKSGIWISTLDGLNEYDESIGGFRSYHEKDGLSSNIIMCTKEDDAGNLWMSTSRGITKMIHTDSKKEFQTFDVSDGLQGESFTEDAGIKTKSGMLLFSGQNGFNIFDPSEIYIKEQHPKMLFTNLFISNNKVISKVEFNGRVILDRPLNDTKSINLYHDENSIAFEFVALSFFQSGKIKYQYMLEGFDKQWINCAPGVRSANYTNLAYGSYTFRVRCANGQNSWTEPHLSIKIQINPPFWQTSWAFAAYMLMVAFILYAIRASIIRRERLKAQVENDRREVERQHELDMMKIKFFTNISHEFRTPLSLIITPIEQMIKNSESIKATDLNIVHRNAKRLMTLVTQLLDFRKMEANQHTLNPSTGDIVAFLRNIADSFSDMSREKSVRLQFECDIKKYYTVFDKDKMEKIMFNLLSNAFKFTLPGGHIIIDFELTTQPDGSKLGNIMVTDTGIGIPEEKHQLIFNRFFQNEVTGSIINNGTGIGLSITKEFVEMHGGKVWVESKPELGSTFFIEMPLKAISTDEMHESEKHDGLESETPLQNSKDELLNKDLPSIFLVEDNHDFRFYLKDNLKQYYNVAEASNGKDALKLIRQKLPDIIISDVMMPVMDGHERCEKIKSDPRTSHIPIILLTAQSSDEHKIQGLESGAIDYISKPFNFDILVSSINSALKFQLRVKDFENMIKVEPQEIEIESMDEKMITKAMLLVDQNMANAEFSVEDLSHELGYSRGHFYQKILKITGQTPMDFIRNIRMKRAAELLKKSQMNVSEVAYKVGYNNPKLFSRYFKSQYDIYPSEFRIKAEKDAEEELSSKR
jgi:signal transduction histidine kinase/ligand-binding sensor domain-containing protein/DNA-binding response OmpR family regulator